MKTEDKSKLIEDSISQIREILNFFEEINQKQDGMKWGEIVYMIDFLRAEVDRIDRNARLKGVIYQSKLKQDQSVFNHVQSVEKRGDA